MNTVTDIAETKAKIISLFYQESKLIANLQKEHQIVDTTNLLQVQYERATLSQMLEKKIGWKKMLEIVKDFDKCITTENY